MAVQKNTNADTKADRDPRAFGTIDATGAEDAANAGPGVVDPTPVQVESGVDASGNSTFASRAAARERAARGETKAVQQSENK